MTTDNQTIEVPEHIKDVDGYCLLLQHIYLQSLADKYHDLKKINELSEYCNSKLSDIDMKSVKSASRCNEIDEFPVVEEVDRIKISKSVSNLQQEEFDILANSLMQFILEWENQCQRIDSELASLDEKQSSEIISLQANQSSEIKILQQKIDAIDDDILSKIIKIADYEVAISTEIFSIAFIAGGFMIGLIGGIQGAIIGLIIAILITRYYKSIEIDIT